MDFPLELMNLIIRFGLYFFCLISEITSWSKILLLIPFLADKLVSMVRRSLKLLSVSVMRENSKSSFGASWSPGRPIIADTKSLSCSPRHSFISSARSRFFTVRFLLFLILISKNDLLLLLYFLNRTLNRFLFSLWCWL